MFEPIEFEAETVGTPWELRFQAVLDFGPDEFISEPRPQTSEPCSVFEDPIYFMDQLHPSSFEILVDLARAELEGWCAANQTTCHSFAVLADILEVAVEFAPGYDCIDGIVNGFTKLKAASCAADGFFSALPALRAIGRVAIGARHRNALVAAITVDGNRVADDFLAYADDLFPCPNSIDLRSRSNAFNVCPLDPTGLIRTRWGSEPTTSVYFGIDPHTGERAYAGLTNDLIRREAQHGALFDGLEPLTHLDESDVVFTRAQAHAVEQALIDRVRQAGTTMIPLRVNTYQNAINSISPNNSEYARFVAWGENWLVSNGYS